MFVHASLIAEKHEKIRDPFGFDDVLVTASYHQSQLPAKRVESIQKII